MRGQLKADRRNLQSQAAVERLGAMREESFATPDGSRWFIRDSVMYSVIDSGGPRVRHRLEMRLGSRGKNEKFGSHEMASPGLIS